MKKNILKTLLLVTIITIISFTASCRSKNKMIRVCASELPHADVLENCVAEILKEQGYTLKVSVLDWTLQNDGVANKDYDANYFQNIPYLETYEGSTKLHATCKVHYEPLGLYQGKSTDLVNARTIAICNDESNAIRALELLHEKNIIADLPVTADGKLAFSGTKWTSSNGVEIVLIAEELLVASMADYDFVCLPCNTAYTGNVDPTKKVLEEDNQTLLSSKANVLAVRTDDYNNDADYKAKIDALTEALLSQEVADYINQKYSGAITCNQYTQIDLR